MQKAQTTAGERKETTKSQISKQIPSLRLLRNDLIMHPLHPTPKLHHLDMSQQRNAVPLSSQTPDKPLHSSILHRRSGECPDELREFVTVDDAGFDEDGGEDMRFGKESFVHDGDEASQFDWPRSRSGRNGVRGTRGGRGGGGGVG